MITNAPASDSPATPRSAAASRRIALVIGLVGLVGLIAGVLAMGRRIDEFQHSRAQKTWVFQVLNERAFKFGGHDVTLTDTSDRAAGMLREFVVVRFGDAELRLPVAVPSKFKLPGLASHEDWLRVLRFAESTGLAEADAAARIARGEIRDRLVIVTRSVRGGTDPGTWGEVRRKDWQFDFHELIAEPGKSPRFENERLGYPTARWGDDEKPGELHEGTWQFSAALFTMPRNRPNPQFRYSALRSLGWVLPATGVSAMLAILGFAFAVKPRRAPA